MGPTVLLAGIYFTTSLLTMFISNTATAVLMAPNSHDICHGNRRKPVSVSLRRDAGGKHVLASPFSTPPNALVMHAGEYTFSDYIKVGLPLQIIIGIVMVFALPLLFPM